MTSSQLRMIHPHASKHLRAMGQLSADVFSGGQYVDAFCDSYIGNSHYDWTVSRLKDVWDCKLIMRI